MKNIIVAAFALVILVGSTVTASTVAAATSATATTNKITPKPAKNIPSPGCPVGDLNGCGIYE
jgi:hypothetical protein